VDVVLACIDNRDYLTVYQLGIGGSDADIDVRILHSLMKGILVVCLWLVAIKCIACFLPV